MVTPDIPVLLADDHPIVRMGLRQAIGSFAGMTVIGEAETGEEALYLCRKLRPSIVIMDLRMEGMGGLEAAKILCAHAPDTRVIAISSFVDRRTASLVEASGVHGFILKNVTAAELEATLRAVHAGRRVVAEEVRRLLDQAPAEDGSPHIRLGAQQKRVLALMTKGFTNGEIAEHMGISTPTARYHVSAILEKLGVSNRTEASAMAVANRLVDEQDF